MALIVRLEPELKRQLEAVCKRRRTTKSAIVTNLIRELVAREAAREPRASSYEIAVKLGLIGSVNSPGRDVAANAKARVRRALRSKYRRRSC